MELIPVPPSSWKRCGAVHRAIFHPLLYKPKSFHICCVTNWVYLSLIVNGPTSLGSFNVTFLFGNRKVSMIWAEPLSDILHCQNYGSQVNWQPVRLELRPILSIVYFWAKYQSPILVFGLSCSIFCSSGSILGGASPWKIIWVAYILRSTNCRKPTFLSLFLTSGVHSVTRLVPSSRQAFGWVDGMMDNNRQIVGSELPMNELLPEYSKDYWTNELGSGRHWYLLYKRLLHIGWIHFSGSHRKEQPPWVGGIFRTAPDLFNKEARTSETWMENHMIVN